jgi:hypothetical protein
MSITTKILFEGISDTWKFEVDNNGYIRTEINEMYSDTLYDLGKIKDIKHLEKVVKHLLNCWQVESYSEMIIVV